MENEETSDGGGKKGKERRGTKAAETNIKSEKIKEKLTGRKKKKMKMEEAKCFQSGWVSFSFRLKKDKTKWP